ncbi:MAG: hypothetical protein Q9195_009234 [Heterodermia aff. obscurata]
MSGLQSAKSTLRLKQIARLRARGLGDHVDLPQLVVCGDQSAGKSSILEGITSLPFPRQDDVCTKFPTEIILRHSDGEQIILATILPTTSRTEQAIKDLQSYKRHLGSFDELPKLIAAAESLMGLRGFESVEKGPAFTQDVLRIEVTGPVGLHLTVVDLPGLISVANEEQTEFDVQTVQNMVDSYLTNARTIILAVVQANNDIANQGIIQKSRRLDPAGERTVGIITKPDLINKGTEKRIARLAKNEDTTKLRLGFFLVRNPTPSELATAITAKQRLAIEDQYFRADRVGVAALQRFLQKLLKQHIERELPKVREEIKHIIKRLEQDIAALGDERPTTGHIRVFLSHLAMRFHNLTLSALDGNYFDNDTAFFDESGMKHQSRRIRALTHRLNTVFSNHMRDNGQKRKVITSLSDSEDNAEESAEEDQILVTKQKMKDWVYVSSRGKELPGNYNHALMSDLFHVQASRWKTIAGKHVETFSNAIEEFVKAAVSHITQEPEIKTKLWERSKLPLLENKQATEEELSRLCEDEKQQPITYNHYYSDNVQKARQDSTRDLIKKTMNEASAEDWNGRLHISNNSVDAEKLVASLQKRIIIDMDAQACTEALVALKTFVDNVCRQVIERHLLNPLSRVFCPEKVAAMDDDELYKIAAKSPENAESRKRLNELHENLKRSLSDLRK